MSPFRGLVAVSSAVARKEDLPEPRHLSPRVFPRHFDEVEAKGRSRLHCFHLSFALTETVQGKSILVLSSSLISSLCSLRALSPLVQITPHFFRVRYSHESSQNARVL